MTEQAFWMVWSPQGHAPTVQHFEEKRAVGEAQRLARENPGREFYVLLAQTKYVKADVQCVRLEPEMPF
jgi:hypothetical protein